MGRLCHILSLKTEKKDILLQWSWPRVILFIISWQRGPSVVSAGCWVRFLLYRAQIQRGTASVVCCSASSDCVSCIHYKTILHIAHCELMWAHIPRCYFAATLMCGIKQTVIDLWHDCLFCLAVSDGWRFASIWKDSVKYGGELVGGGVVLKSTSPRRNPSGPMWRPAITPSPLFQIKCPP